MTEQFKSAPVFLLCKLFSSSISTSLETIDKSIDCPSAILKADNDNKLNSFTFVTLGTYYIQLAYNTRGNGGTAPKLAFITKDSASVQVGPTVLDQTYRQNTSQNNKIINIEIMLNVTTVSSIYTFHALQEDLPSGTLVADVIGAGWTSVPSAGITISKLV